MHGGHTGAFRCFQEAQQGSPLSPLLFVQMPDSLHKLPVTVPGQTSTHNDILLQAAVQGHASAALCR